MAQAGISQALPVPAWERRSMGGTDIADLEFARTSLIADVLG